MQEGIYDAFEKAVTKKVGEFKQGGGLDPSTTLGPLIGHSAVDRVCSGHYSTIAAGSLSRAEDMQCPGWHHARVDRPSTLLRSLMHSCRQATIYQILRG